MMIAAQLFFSYLVDREVGTVAMGANPLAVTAEMANSKAELSFIVYICALSLIKRITSTCRLESGLPGRAEFVLLLTR